MVWPRKRMCVVGGPPLHREFWARAGTIEAMPFVVRDHTADVALVIDAPSLPALFEEACQALLSLLVEEPASVREAECRVFEVPGGDPPDLLVDLLSELLATFETRGWLARRCYVDATADGLRVRALGEPLDRSRHGLTHEVKAITYHRLTVRHVRGRWLAEVIVDV